MMNRSGAVALVLGALALVTQAAPADAQKRDRDGITRAEIEASPHRDLDLYQLVRNLRPHFLEVRGVRSMGGSTAQSTPIALYVDGKRDVGVEGLRNIRAADVDGVRYLNPTTAQNELGPHAANGAVIVRMKKRRIPEQTSPPSSRDDA